MVKIQNISKDERKLFIKSKWVYIKPNEIIEIEKVPEQTDIFKEINEENTAYKPIKIKKEVKKHDSSSSR